MKRIVSLLLALALLLTCAFPAALAEETSALPQEKLTNVLSMFSGLAGKLKDTVRIGLAGLFAGLMGGLRGNGDGDWASQDADDWSDGILSDFDGTFWESGEIRLATSYEQGNYRFSIRDGGAVSSFLCAYPLAG